MTSNRTQLILLSLYFGQPWIVVLITKTNFQLYDRHPARSGAYFTAFYFGRKEGVIVGGVGAFLLTISGYPQWMFLSPLHGDKATCWLQGQARYPGGLLLATVVMVGGYAPVCLFVGKLLLGVLLSRTF